MLETLFLAADYEAQELAIRADKEKQPHVYQEQYLKLYEPMRKHFLYSVLLSDSVIIPIGCYFQSEIVQMLFDEYRELFVQYKGNEAIVGFGLDIDMDSFADDAKKKAGWFQDPYVFADQEKILSLAKKLNGIIPKFRDGKMRGILANNLLNDISLHGNSYTIVSNSYVISGSKPSVFLSPIKSMAEVQEYALLPPYIKTIIEKQRTEDFSVKSQKRWLEFILFKNYAQSCSEIYDAYCNNPLMVLYDEPFKKLYPYTIDYRDTLLFEKMQEFFPYKDIENIYKLSATDVLRIKECKSYNWYLYYYRMLINNVRETTKFVDFSYVEYEGISKSAKQTFDAKINAFTASIAKNASEAEVLYELLRNSSKRVDTFHDWLIDSSADPIVKMAAYIGNRREELLEEYIYLLSRNIHKKGRRKMGKISLKAGGSIANPVIHQGDGDIIIKGDIKESDIETNVSVIELAEKVEPKVVRQLKKEIQKRNDTELKYLIDSIERIINNAKSGKKDDFDKDLEVLKNTTNSELWRNKLKELTNMAGSIAGIGSFIVSLIGALTP